MAEGIRIGGGGRNYGTNVWKKREWLPETTVENPSFSAVVNGSTKTMKLSNSNFDLTRVKNYKTFFKNFKYDSGWYFGDNPTVDGLAWVYNYGSYALGVTAFNASAKTFTLSVVPQPQGQNREYVYTFSGTKTFPAVAGETIGFVVNDDPNAYPNKAVHTDGYYYELLGQVSSANVMSLSDNAVAAVQQDYRDTIETEVSNANS